MLKYIPYVLLTALITMFIYGWGLMKSQRQQGDLMSMLYSKCDRKVRKALKRNGKMSKAELENLLSGTRVALFFSKNRLGVTNPQLFTKSLLDFMMEHNIVAEETINGKKMYHLINQ